MNDIAIQVSNLTKIYQLYDQPIDRLKEALNFFGKKYHTNFSAVKELSFKIKKGETVGIIGRNGCGKSTLLKMITNVLTPSSGRVMVSGHVSAILELGAGFNPEMTGLENIYINNAINGLSKDQTNQKVDEIIDFSELGEFIHQPIKIYSSGMKARLAFAVAINVKPDILIVDEALSVGDAAFQRKCFAKMEEIRANGSTVLFVSHSESSIVNLCNRVIWLSNGEKVLDGIPKLITGLYLKYSNEKQINKKKVSDEYQELINKNGISDEKIKITTIEKEKSKILEEYYNPKLKPTSTIYFDEHGAKISDVNLTNLDGEKVNVLVQGSEYIYSYKITLKDKNEKVLCAMLIKNKQGVELGGGHFPERNQYLQINKNEFFVKWNWKCNLVDGDYFFNCGISNEKGFLHRIIDNYYFKVRNNDKDKQSYRFVDFNIRAQYE